MSKLYLLKRDRYPITVQIFSRHGWLLWGCVIELMDRGELHAVAIPGYGGTDHVPVRTVITYANGTIEEG